MKSVRSRTIIALFAIGSIASSASGATFTIRSTDGAGEGLNDTTAFTPVGGNGATTLGQARMNVLLEAARIWGSLLQSNVPILVDAKFDPQTCTATSGTLGAAGPRSAFRDFANAPRANTYYVGALANAIAGSRLASNPTSADIGATFNSSVDSDATCLGGRGFYYGLDHNRGTKVDLLLVMLHEFGHGLGFTSQVDLTTGQGTTGSDGIERFDAFTYLIFDETLNDSWPNLTDAQRVTSATNNGKVGWNGANVNAQKGLFTAGVTASGRLRLYAPTTVSSGSSISHFDTAVTPSVLMEPNLPSSITTSSTDITVCALQDIGWTVSVCPHFNANHPPVANAQSVTTLEDTAVTITLTGSDIDNDPLTFAVAVPPTKGTLSSISPTAPHTVIYTPNADANGSDVFTFSVNDASSTSSANVNVTVTPVNDAPTVSDATAVALSGIAEAITLTGRDVDGDPLTYSIVTMPSHGTATIAGSLVSYTSAAGYVGADSFTYRANDGALNSSAATVAITVQAGAQVNTLGSSGGGGGALSFAWLMSIASLGMARVLRRR